MKVEWQATQVDSNLIGKPGKLVERQASKIISQTMS